jgi:large subunit ribosomal protein L15
MNTLAPAKGARTKKFRVGRGEGSGRGKTSGKGTKGQRSRTGGRKGLKLKGIKQMILGFPKLRGFRSTFTPVVTLPLERIAKVFNSPMTVDLKALKSKELVARSAQRVKLVGTAALEKPLNFVNISASASAKAAVEKAGGSFKSSKTKKKVSKK